MEELQTDTDFESSDENRSNLIKDLASLIKVSLLDKYVNFTGTGVVASDGKKSFQHLSVTSFVCVGLPT